MKSNNKNIVWITSYPKSGNTWFRVFLMNLLSNSDEPISINELSEIPLASNRILLEPYFGVSTSDLNDEEIDIVRPEVYRMISKESSRTTFFKVHEAWKPNQNGESIYPPDITKAVIYIIRNPLDVAVSYSNHNGITLDEAIQNMNNSKHGLCFNNSRIYTQLSQQLDSWSNHVESWVRTSPLKVKVIRYEDMLNTPLETFSEATKYLGLRAKTNTIKEAIHNSNFNILKEQEKLLGFKEKPISLNAFFHSGKSETWRTILTASQTNKLINNHKSIMKEYGYLP